MRLNDVIIKIMSTKNQIKIVQWDAYATWTFDSPETVCSICRDELTTTCINCLNKTNNINCKVSKGKCGHTFHFCCINNWRKKSNICPICTTSWAVEVDDMNVKNVTKVIKK